MRISEDCKLDFEDVLLVPKRGELNSRNEVSINRTFIMKHSREEISGCPVIAANMFNTGTFAMSNAMSKRNMFTALHKHYKQDEYMVAFNDFCFSQNKWIYTTGISEEDKKRLEFLASEAGYFPSLVCIDVPNGYIPKVSDFIKYFRDRYDNQITLMVGNVVTPNMTEQLILDGTDIIKVGIGGGSFCTTRLVAGVGYPQLSAIVECSDVAHGLNAHICSDGGIKCVGDICKAFCAGADFVMAGGIFMGYEENEGEWKTEDRGYKENCKTWLKTFGMSSKHANEKFSGGLKDYRASEGREACIRYKGKVDSLLQEIEGGLRSCGSYIGAKRLKDFAKCASFVKVNRTHNKAVENGNL